MTKQDSGPIFDDNLHGIIIHSWCVIVEENLQG